METSINSIPGYRVYDYLLVIKPHEELWQRILRVKEEFAQKYKAEAATWSRPHIVLASFQQLAMMEERIVNRLKNIAMAHPPFKVELKDFGSFPSHTVHINVTSKLPVQGLVKTIRTELQRLLKMDDSNKPQYMLEPHITIAKKLLPWQYEKGWLEYSHKHFTGRFIADSMYLLRRAQGDKKFHPCATLEFQNLPVLTKQGELFG